MAAVLLAPRLVPESRAEAKAEWTSSAPCWLTAGLVAIVLPLVEGRQEGWPELDLGGAGRGRPLLGAFVAYQRSLGNRGGSPLVSLELFRERAFSVGIVTIMAYHLVMASFFLVLALYLQAARACRPWSPGWSSCRSASATSPPRWSAQAGGKLGRQVLAVGSLVVSAGYLLIAVVLHDGAGWLIPGLVISGIGMGFVIAPLPAIVLARVKPEDAAAASGVLSTAQQAGGSIGVAVIGAVFYSALGSGSYPHAFGLSLVVMAAFGLAVAALVQFLRRTA